MPFPLAHPAAVIPLARYCPRYLSVPALVVGSVVPDLAYLLPFPKADEWSHGAWGAVGFALPMGLLCLGILLWVDAATRRRWPSSCLRAALPALPPFGLSVGIVVSLLIGALTHLLWDSFTHRNGWIVQQSSFLQVTVAQVRGHSVRVCHLLWYLFSFAGAVWVWMASEKWVLEANSTSERSLRSRLLDAVVFATLLLPIEILHHNSQSHWGLVLAGVLTTGLIAGAAARIVCLARGKKSAGVPR
jgi:hypothetical protein